MRRSWIVGGVIASAGCGEAAEVPVPGLLEPSCAMTWAAYEVTTVDLPELRDDVLALGLDVDQVVNDSQSGIDNQIGSLMALVTSLFPESWDPQAAFNARLAAGSVHWVMEVGTCADGDEVRVVSAQAADADGDGVLEIVARGVPSVGRGGGATVRGLGWVPIGGLAAGSPTSGTDGWLSGLGLTTDLTVTGDRVSGRLAIGLDPDADAAVTPVMNFFNERLVAGTSPGARRRPGRGPAARRGWRSEARCWRRTTTRRERPWPDRTRAPAACHPLRRGGASRAGYSSATRVATIPSPREAWSFRRSPSNGA